MSVTAEVIKVEDSADANKNLVVWVQFKNDGVEIPQQNTINGKQCWRLWIREVNLIGKDLSKKREWVQINIENQIENYILAIARTKVNNDLVVGDLGKMVGDIYSKDYAVTEYTPGYPSKVYPNGTITIGS